MQEFELDQVVQIGSQRINGTVVGITKYSAVTGYSTNYMVRYLHPQTYLPVEEWYTASLLTAF